MTLSHILYPLLALLIALPTTAAHLPAIRRQPVSKRALASKLIRHADHHKERSLHDVLTEQTHMQRVRKPSVPRRDPTTHANIPRTARPEQPEGEEHTPEEKIRTLSQLFAWAINNTVYSTKTNVSSGLFTASGRDEPPVATRGSGPMSVKVEVELPPELAVQEESTAGKRKSETKALPRGTGRKANGHTSRMRKKAKKARMERDAADFETLSSSTESEFDVLRRNVHLIHAGGGSSGKTVRALRVVEELCHSIDNGRDLQVSGGLSPLLGSLGSRDDAVRASAAWALATCCQNNPPVQNASLGLGAVPRLARMALSDGSTMVRSKALFALNALLELESARLAFEELPFAVQVLRKALVDSSDFRATRRALNLTELLVQKNLDPWKTQLEAWDIPVLIERLMRSHPDSDVRESAARTIAALDGRLLA